MSLVQSVEPKLTPDLSSTAELYASLVQPMRAGTAAWVRLGGLAIDGGTGHSALCTTLHRLGVGDERLKQGLEIVVLDWTQVPSCSAEALAFFAVLVRHLHARGARVVVCGPAAAVIAKALTETGVQDACGMAEWIPCAASGGAATQVIARAAIFGSCANDSIGNFCDDLSASLKEMALPRSGVRAVMGTTQELLHNVLSHARASNASAVALLLPRKRPKVLQVGIADDGLGVATTVLAQERHQWLGWFSDGAVTEVVLRDALSGRDDSTDQGENGGGMARILGRILAETTSTFMLRSGSALITLRSTHAGKYETARLTYGVGTQMRLEMYLA